MKILFKPFIFKIVFVKTRPTYDGYRLMDVLNR
jgi:hypothetical protein